MSVGRRNKQTKKKKGEALFISFHFQNENKKGGDYRGQK